MKAPKTSKNSLFLRFFAEKSFLRTWFFLEGGGSDLSNLAEPSYQRVLESSRNQESQQSNATIVPRIGVVADMTQFLSTCFWMADEARKILLPSARHLEEGRGTTILELLRLENCISRLCPRPLGDYPNRWAQWPLHGSPWVLKYPYCHQLITQTHPRGNERVSEKVEM